MPTIFKKIDKIKPVYDVVYKVVLFICKILLIADIAITCLTVMGRHISFIPAPAWGEEIVRTLMVYMALLSAALALRKGTHIRMTALDKWLPEKLIYALDVLADIAVMGLAVIMVVAGWKYASTIGAIGKFISMPSVSKIWLYLPIPIAGVAMVVFEIESLYNHIKKFFVKEDKEYGN